MGLRIRLLPPTGVLAKRRVLALPKATPIIPTVPTLQQNGGGAMGKLDGKVAVITGATSGMALATARLFVEEGAFVFVTGRRKDKLDEAVRSIGRNVTGVQGDAADLADLDRLYE